MSEREDTLETMQQEQKHTRTKPVKCKTQLISVAFIVCMMGVTMGVLSRKVDFSLVFSVIARAQPFWLIIALLCAFGYIGFQALAIYLPMRSFGSTVPFMRCVAYSALGYYYSSITPSATGGQPMQMYYMCRDRENFSDVSLMIVLTNIVYQVVVLFLAFVFVMLAGTAVWGYIETGRIFVILGVIVALGFAALLFLVLRRPGWAMGVGRWILKAGSALHLVKNKDKALLSLCAQIASYHVGAKTMFHNRKLVFAVCVCTAMQMLCQYAIPLVACAALRMVIPGGAFVLMVFALQAVIQISVCFIPLPGGVGMSEGLFTVFFLPLLGNVYTVPCMVLARFFSFYLMLILDGLVAMYVHLTPRCALKDPLVFRMLTPEESREVYEKQLVRHFPDAQRDASALLGQKEYTGYGLFSGKTLLVYGFLLPLSSGNVVLEYLAVREAYRQEGLGTTFLSRLKSGLPSSAQIYVSVPDPVGAQDDAAVLAKKKCIAFYEKCGYVQTGVVTTLGKIPYRVLVQGCAASRRFVREVLQEFYKKRRITAYEIASADRVCVP